MNLNTVLSRMPHWYAARKSVYLTSPPGRGKSTTIEAGPQLIGEKFGLNLGLVIINGAMLTPMDVLGYGVPKHGEERTEMLFSLPFFWRTTEGKFLEDYDGGILFVDEADKADVDVKKILGEGALSGRFGPHKLPQGWVVWMAGNRSEDRSGSTKELDHLINRRMEIAITDDLPSWTDWAVTRGVTPIMVSWVNSNPQIVFEGKVPEKQGPWCTPRSAVQLDEYLRALAAGNGGDFPDDPTTIEEASGMIGSGAAAQFFAHVRLDREMPKFEAIIKDPGKVRVPDKPDACMLVCYNLAYRVNKDNAGPVVQYVDRMPKEFGVTFAVTACRRDNKLVGERAFFDWAKQNSSLMAAITR